MAISTDQMGFIYPLAINFNDVRGFYCWADLLALKSYSVDNFSVVF